MRIHQFVDDILRETCGFCCWVLVLVLVLALVLVVVVVVVVVAVASSSPGTYSKGMAVTTSTINHVRA